MGSWKGTQTKKYKTVISAGRAEDRSTAKSEEARLDLRASEERFGKAFAQAAVGMSLADTKGRFLQVNDAFCDILGFTREELAEIDSYAITHPEDRERYAAFTRQMLAGEINDYVIEKRCLKKDGGVVWVRKSVSLARDAEGEPSDIITLTEDITVRKHSEDALARRARLNRFERGCWRSSHKDRGPAGSASELCRVRGKKRRCGRAHLDAQRRWNRVGITSQCRNVQASEWPRRKHTDGGIRGWKDRAAAAAPYYE